MARRPAHRSRNLPKNEDGEFELILGNRQLLSVFFIVVVLLGVFFTMGYVVGRNSTPLSTADAAPAYKTKPGVVDSPTPTPEPVIDASSSAPPKETAPQQPAPEPKAPETKPRETPKQVAKAESPKPAPAGDSPASGQIYLQLAATSKHEADIEVDVLRKKGFKAIAAEIPEKPGTVRVLVGPLAGESINKTKSDLNAAGFPGDRAIRRTF
jgi:cell division septation protein DedD